MQYFSNCKTIEEVKAHYKQLAKQYHPDLGGDTVTMQAINREYTYACARLANGAGLSDEQADNEIKLSELYREAIEKIIYLPGIIIELVGHWIWVTGNTKPVKDNLKDAHFFFAQKNVHGISGLMNTKPEVEKNHWMKSAKSMEAKTSIQNSTVKCYTIKI